jgi:hypothetical protein
MERGEIASQWETHADAWTEQARRGLHGVLLGDYFNRGEADTWWMAASPNSENKKPEGFRTPRFHRTLSDWVEMITKAGLTMEALGEPRADADLLRAAPGMAETAVTPLFLHIRARNRSQA